MPISKLGTNVVPDVSFVRLDIRAQTHNGIVMSRTAQSRSIRFSIALASAHTTYWKLHGNHDRGIIEQDP